MAELTVPQLSFSALGQLPQVYQKAQAQRGLQEALAGGVNTADPQSLAQLAARVLPYDATTGLSLAQLGNTAQNRQQDMQWRQEEAKRAQSNADRSYGLQARSAARADDRTPTNFVPDPTAPGGYRPIGPASPEYKAQVAKAEAEATAQFQKPRQMSIGDITKLSEEGGKFANLNTFGETFKPEFAGRTILGDTANIAGRNLPEAVVGKNVADGASWWQGYDRYKNVVRNELFGSALTAPEKAAFEQADISPRMDPAQIKKNLATQKAIAENGLKRKANAMISAGYSPEAISSAYGVKIDAAPRASSQPSQGNGADAMIGHAREALSAGAPREAVLQRLKAAGIDTSGL